MKVAAKQPERRPLLRLDRAARRRMFHLKSDLPVEDELLRSLRERADGELRARVPAIAELAAKLHLGGEVRPLAAGSFHLVHRLDRADGTVVFRSTLSDLFVEDRTLLFDRWVRNWLGTVGRAALVPETRAVEFTGGGAPFDFSVLAFADGIVLRELGDPILDVEPEFLRGLGLALRLVHEVEGTGAGLLDGDAGGEDAPRGVHDAWTDYIDLRLQDHARTCVDAGYITAADADTILHLFEAMRPSVAARPRRLLHGDPGTHNVCVDPDTRRVTSLLDWEDALVGDPLFDVAMAISFHPERRHAPLLAGYGLDRPTIEDRRLIALYFLRIALFKTTHRLRFAIADLPGRVPGHHRILSGVNELVRLM
ncbi:MAG: aminoglycoside phosphotransferase family protein [Xanthobacteraceae bacterium]|nr:aminoglycoside phosphotransferase family protein [Xanthobacteraceae bacterium]